MHLIKDVENIDVKDREIAKSIIERLRQGDRVIGNPAEGLKQTLKKIEEEHSIRSSAKNVLDYVQNDDEYNTQHKLLQAGINGEEELAEYLEQVVKYDKELQDIIYFASLSDPEQNSGGDDYISDSDFIAIYGNNILIMDAKNIITNPDLPIYLQDSVLVAAGGKEILELHPSTFVWANVFARNNIEVESLHGCVVIVNKRGASIWRNPEWFNSEVKPIHIGDLVQFLHDWIQDKKPNVNLSLLVTLAKMQIKKEKSNLGVREKATKLGF